MTGIKIAQGGFVFLTVDSETAVKIWTVDLFGLYILYPDDSEGLIESEEDLEVAVDKGELIGIEVGFINSENNNIEK